MEAAFGLTVPEGRRTQPVKLRDILNRIHFISAILASYVHELGTLGGLWEDYRLSMFVTVQKVSHD